MNISRRGFLHSLSGIGLMLAGVAKAAPPDRPEHAEDGYKECGTCLRLRTKYLRDKTPANLHALDRSMDYHQQGD